MEYFRLISSSHMKEPLKSVGIDINYYKLNIDSKDFEKVPSTMISYYTYKPELEFPDFLSAPIPLFSTELINVLQLYEEETKYKAVHYFAEQLEVKKSKRYWFAYINQIECLHESCERTPNGSIRELILDRNKIANKDVFRIKGILEDMVILSLPVAESILRRGLYGIGFEKVKVL